MTVIQSLKEHIKTGKHSEGSAIAWLMKYGELSLPAAMNMMKNA